MALLCLVTFFEHIYATFHGADRGYCHEFLKPQLPMPRPHKVIKSDGLVLMDGNKLL